MATEISIDRMQEIKKEYPDFFNHDLPFLVRCPQQRNGDDHLEELKKTFTRTCSRYFQVKEVKIYKNINRCQCIVTYSLKSNEDLPVEPDLKDLVSLLLKYAPQNAVILKEQRLLELPKNVIVPYEIFCDCPKKFFDVAANPPEMQPLIEKFEVLLKS